MTKSRQEKLVGVVVSLPSFCDGEYNLLLDRQRKHIRWLIDHGIVEGAGVLMISGGLGEGYFLDDDEWRTMADVLAEEAGGRVPTMIGVFELSARRAAKKARYAAKAGIDFIQLAPPHYMVPSDADVLGHYRYVNDAAEVGIMAYNIPWAMPKPGFEFGPRLLERLGDLENVVGVKWSSHDVRHYLGMLRLFGDRFNFIDNMMIFSLGFRLGMKGFINFHANIAPRLALKMWRLLQQKQYDAFDQMWLKMRFDPFIKVARPEEQAWVGVGEGPTSRMTLRAFGMDAGPAFPAQAEPPPAYLDRARQAIEASGILEWVDWDQSLFDE
jgi:dihydrodipicolinate synthase/N-acetylneuraminate lyase